MAAINDTTRKMITTAIKGTTDAYRDGWERIFGGVEDGTAKGGAVQQQNYPRGLPTADNPDMPHQSALAATHCRCPACGLMRENQAHWRKLRGRS